MRPLPSGSDSLIGRGAHHGDDANLSSPPNHPGAPPLRCFLATESELDAASDRPAPPTLPPAFVQKPSHESTNLPTPAFDQHQSPGLAPHSSVSAANSSPLSSSSSASSLLSYSPSAIGHGVLDGNAGPLASLFADLSRPESAISTSSSRRNSLTASSLSYRDSSAPSAAAAPRNDASHQDAVSSPVPQLIMPSLNVPRRRPFSDAGRSIGKLKVLVAGQAGIGKTSLIQSLSQSCEHIVHVDPVTTPRPGQIVEVYASTRAQPWWRRSRGRDSLAGTRRSSTGDILDRNLCFVDGSVLGDHSTHALEYVESRLTSLLENPMDETGLLALLSSGAESLVDVVLYLISHTGPTDDDLERLRVLQGMTNVIPLLARADELDSENVTKAKLQLCQAMDDEHIDYFSFSMPGTPKDIYAVSNATRPDNDVMDASILMSSVYMPPLVMTDLSVLVGHMFSSDGSAWLRHSAAVKCVQWRRQRMQNTPTRDTALLHRRGTMVGALSPVLTANPFAQRRQWGRVEVSDWAWGLRQSLAAERRSSFPQQSGAQSEASLCDSSRAVVRQKHGRDKPSRSRKAERQVNTPHQDPLGLLELAAQVRYGGRLTLELLSSLGILGCVASWLIRPEQACHQDMKWLSVLRVVALR